MICLKTEEKDHLAVAQKIPIDRISLLQNGEAYFPAVEAALDRAVHEIYLESYIFENGHAGRRISEALRRAASRGVKTHLLIDGYGSSRLPQSMVDYIMAAGVMVLRFRPKISPWTLRRKRLRRLHRKIVVVDQRIAIVGGINIVDDLVLQGQIAARYDCAVSVEGPLVKQIHDSARRVWLRVACSRLRLGWGWDVYSQAPAAEPGGPGRCAFVVRDNWRHRSDIEDAYLKAIKLATSEIIIANAYFLPGVNFRHSLVDAARRGVRVVLLLQGKADHRLLQHASHALYGSFLDAGIEIYEYHKSLLHAKVAVIDGHWATVGSSNLDPFSLLLALEANVVVDDATFAKELKQSLDRAIEIGARRIFRNNWRTQPIRRRLASWLSYGLVRFMTGMAGYAPRERARLTECFWREWGIGFPDFSADAFKELEAIQQSDRVPRSPAQISHLLWASIDNDDSLDLDQLTVAEALADAQVKVLVAVAEWRPSSKKARPSMPRPPEHHIGLHRAGFPHAAGETLHGPHLAQLSRRPPGHRSKW